MEPPNANPARNVDIVEDDTEKDVATEEPEVTKLKLVTNSRDFAKKSPYNLDYESVHDISVPVTDLSDVSPPINLVVDRKGTREAEVDHDAGNIASKAGNISENSSENIKTLDEKTTDKKAGQ